MYQMPYTVLKIAQGGHAGFSNEDDCRRCQGGCKGAKVCVLGTQHRCRQLQAGAVGCCVRALLLCVPRMRRREVRITSRPGAAPPTAGASCTGGRATRQRRGQLPAWQAQHGHAD